MFEKLPSLKETINQFNLLAKKSLGQNFLLNMNVVRKIAKAAGDLSQCTVIEIGPGPGGLTRALLEESANVIAIERDSRCIAILQDLEVHAQGKLRIVEGDALVIKPQDLCPGPIKIVANLPYNIGTILLTNWLQDLSHVQSLTLMFQKEVALRIVAQPNTSHYGRLSVLANWLTHTQRLFDLPPGAFTPPPKVTSSVVQLIPRSLSQEDLFLLPFLEQVTRAAFSQRRKMLRTSLKGLFRETDLEKAGINPELRPETLTVANFLTLARLLSIR